MTKEIIALPFTPGKSIKIKQGTEIVWRQEPRELYHNGLLPWKLYRKIADNPAAGVGTMIGLVAAVPTLVIAVAAAGFNAHGTTNLPAEIGMLTIFGPMSLGALVGVVPGIRQRRLLRNLQINVIVSFSDWVNERYNLHTTPKTFNKHHVDYILRRNSSQATGTFSSDGKEFNIRFDDEGRIHIEEHAPEMIYDYRPDASIAAITAPETVPAIDLTGEAAVLATKLFDLLKILTDLDASIKHGHVIKRVREDLQTTLDLHRSLLRFGEIDLASQQLIIANLTDLGIELGEIIATEKESVKRQLLVQQTYIRDRKQAAPNPTLQLEPIDQPEPEKATTRA